MNEFTECNICDNPGTLADSSEVGYVYSNVREFKDNKFTLWRCTTCGSLHCKESVDLDYYYAHYPMQDNSLNYVNATAYKHNRLRALKKQGLKEAHRILDFGCGSGSFVTFLRQQGYDATGYDAFDEYHSDRKALQTKYDVIASYDVIEHFDEPSDFFDQVVPCLKGDGLLAVDTPNAADIDLSDTGNVELHQPYHRHLLSKQGLISLARRYKLEPVMISDRWYFDTLYPLVNSRFIHTLLRCRGNILDDLFEEPKASLFFTHPNLMFYSLFGYFFPPKGHMLILFRFSH